VTDKGETGSFDLNKSILLRKRIIEVLVNQREFATDSNRVIASCIRLTVSSSYNLWSSICQLWSRIQGRRRTFADGDEEDEGGDRVEDVEPFTSASQL
jgi:hypothetical protein